MKELSIYVHVPFCSSKCYYCGFCSFSNPNFSHEDYFKSLLNEIKLKSNLFKEYIVKTIYIGGGTPSVVDEKHIKDVVETIKKCFDVSKDVEITIELNPNSTTVNKLNFYKKIGINRISFGVQTFNKKSLLYVGRLKNKEEAKHYKKNVFSILKQAKEIGFKNISVDFILGLPFQSVFDVKRFIKQTSKFVTHFSCYMLQIEDGTKLKEIITKQIYDEYIVKQYETAVKVLKKLGFSHYEISNFCKKGFESKHNNVYWNRGSYLGVGLSAHSFYKNERFANTENFSDYCEYWGNCKKFNIKELEEKNIISYEKLTKKQCAEETVMLALRTSTGLKLSDYKLKYLDLEKRYAKKIASYKKNGFIKIEDDFLRLTEKGMLVANEIIINFVEYLDNLIDDA